MDAVVRLLITLPARYLSGGSAIRAGTYGWLQDVVLLAVRAYVGWQFWKAGLIKLQSWDSTVFLFQYEYRVPLLPPNLAAILGTFGELFFPALLFAGLTTRLAALGLSFVNVMAVVAYAHVIFSEGFENTVTDHWVWGLMLLTVMVFGGGRLSADHLLTRWRSAPKPQ